MTANLELPKVMVFMKVGFHSTETLEAIVHRKRQEQTHAGYIFWGYGGTLCHPTRAIRPFVERCKADRLEIPVVMAVTPSKFNSEPTAATEFSEDGVVWHPVPFGVKVTASRYALVMRDLRLCNAELDLGRYLVGFGPSEGKWLSEYIRGRVDKGVARLSDPGASTVPLTISVSYVADLIEPYAVLLR